MSLDGLIYKVKRTSALAGTGSQYRPEAFAPGPALFAASALSNIAVYDNKAYRLLCKIVCRLNAWRCNKSEVSVTMLAKTVSEILCWTTFRDFAQRNIKERFAAFVHSFSKCFFRKFFGFVKNAEHITHRIKKFLTVIGGSFISKARQIFKFPDKMSDAKLHKNMAVFHILVIGREIVAANNSGKIFTENINKYPRTACMSDFEQSVGLRTKTPCPETLAVFLMAGFINVQRCFIGQRFKQFIIGLLKSSDAMNIESSFLGSQILSSSLPTGLLSDKFRVLLEKNIDMPS